MITSEAVKNEMQDFLNSLHGVCDGAGDGGIELGVVLDAIVERLGKKGFNTAEDVKRIKNLVNNFGSIAPFKTQKNKRNLIAICLNPIQAPKRGLSGFSADPRKAPTQSELVKMIASSTDLPQSTVKAVLQVFQKELVESLKGSGKFTISGVCTLEVNRQANAEPILTLHPLKLLKEIGLTKDATTC